MEHCETAHHAAHGKTLNLPGWKNRLHEKKKAGLKPGSNAFCYLGNL